MIVTTPAAMPKVPVPTTPAAHDAPTTPAPHDPPSGAAPSGATPAVPTPHEDAPAPAAPGGTTDAKSAVVDRLMKTSAAEAMAEVDGNLAKLSALTIDGSTPEGAANATAATNLLTDSSMLLQHAHVKAMEDLHQVAGDLHVRLMSSASGLAFLGGQVAAAGKSPSPVKLADVAAGQIAETEEAMHDVSAVLSALNGPAQPKPGEVINETHAPNGNGGIVGPITADGSRPAPKPVPAGDGEIINETHAPNGNTGVTGPLTRTGDHPAPKPAAAGDGEIINETHAPNGNTGVVGPIRLHAPAPNTASTPMKAAIEQLAADIRNGNVRIPPPGVM